MEERKGGKQEEARKGGEKAIKMAGRMIYGSPCS
jgi:hypothetical protein